MDWLKIPPIATKGDKATLLIFGTAGFILDLTLLPGGVPPGTMAMLCASGAIGVKNGFEAYLDKEKLEHAEGTRRQRILETAKELEKVLVASQSKKFKDELKRSVELFEKKIIGSEQLEAIIAKTAEDYRTQPPSRQSAKRR